jgi:hypothetical protein
MKYLVSIGEIKINYTVHMDVSKSVLFSEFDRFTHVFNFKFDTDRAAQTQGFKLNEDTNCVFKVFKRGITLYGNLKFKTNLDYLEVLVTVIDNETGNTLTRNVLIRDEGVIFAVPLMNASLFFFGRKQVPLVIENLPFMLDTSVDLEEDKPMEDVLTDLLRIIPLTEVCGEMTNEEKDSGPLGDLSRYTSKFKYKLI